MRNIVFLPLVHATKRSVLFLNPDEKNNKCVIEVAENQGKRADGTDLPAIYHTLQFRGKKLSEVAALMIPSGTPLIIQGHLSPYLKDSGWVDKAGKKVMERKCPIVVDDWKFAGETLKSIATTVTANLARGKTEGVIAPQTNVGADYLLTRQNKNVHRPYNEAEVLASGKFGNSDVWRKGDGFIGPRNKTMTGPAAPIVGTEPTIDPVEIAALKAELIALKSAQAAQAGAVPKEANAGVDPFAG
jgi:hypothetical protein